MLALRPLLLVAFALLAMACGSDAKPQEQQPAPVPDGWKTFSSATFELSLPASFVGGEPGTAALATGVQQLEALGQRDLAAKLQAFAPNTVLQMIDGDGSAAVSVFWASVPATGFVLKDYDIFASLNPQASGLKLLNRRTVKAGSLSLERLEMRNEAVSIDLLAYYVVQDAKLWSVVFTSSPANTPRWTPVFEQSAGSIRILD